MKRASIILTGLIFMTVFGLKTYAQSDDVYYDPNTDKGSSNNSRDYPQQNTQQNYNDGYGTQGARLKGSKTYVDSSGNTIINNNYYEDSYYSTQLERFYRPSCGFGYYDYAYTPAFYWGWGGLGFGYGGYYGYDAYWGWNSGWGLCGYYNPWYGPYGYGYGGFGYGYGYGAFGYGRGYGYGRGFGYGRGYGYGRGEGYGNRYYGATAGNSYYFSEPHHKDAHFQSNGYAAANNTAHPNLGNPVSGTNGGYKPTGNVPQTLGKGARVNQNNDWKQVEPAGWNNSNAQQGNHGNRANRNNNVQAQQQNQRPQGQYGNNAPQQRSNNPGQSQGNVNHSEQRNSAPAQNYHGGGNNTGSNHNSGGNMGSYHNSGGNSSGGSYHSSGGGGGSYHSSGGGGGGGSHSGGGGRH